MNETIPYLPGLSSDRAVRRLCYEGGIGSRLRRFDHRDLRDRPVGTGWNHISSATPELM